MYLTSEYPYLKIYKTLKHQKNNIQEPTEQNNYILLATIEPPKLNE